MKKLFSLIVLVCMAWAVPVKAQIALGVKGGYNLTSMSFDKSVLDVSNQTGFFVGPTLKITLPILGLGIDAAALYDQRNVKYLDDELKQETIQVPVNLRYGIGLGSIANLFIFAGPQFGFPITGKDKHLANVDWHFKDSALSGNVGLGVTLLKHLQASVNYNFMIGETGTVDLGSSLSSYSDIKSKSHAWQLALAYYF